MKIPELFDEDGTPTGFFLIAFSYGTTIIAIIVAIILKISGKG